MSDLIVSEIFGPTFQGEGPNVGRRAVFLRMGLCNLSCAYCDTPFTWDWHGKIGPPQNRDALRHITAPDLAEIVRQHLYGLHRARLLVVTGGEPMIQQRRLHDVFHHLSYSLDIEIETNGTLMPETRIAERVRFNVSPKLAFADTRNAIDYSVLAHYAGLDGTAFKFVIAEPSDLDEIGSIIERAGIEPSDVWVMPEGRDSATIVKRTAAIADAVLDSGYNLTTRLHVLAWEDERAR